MQKFFIAVAVCAASAIATVDPYCCELYSEENFQGEKFEACLAENFWGERPPSYSKSFTGGRRDKSKNFSNMESFKCGEKVNAHFCLGESLQKWLDDGSTDYQCKMLAFEAKGGDEEAANLKWKNTIGSIVLFDAEDGLVDTTQLV